MEFFFVYEQMREAVRDVAKLFPTAIVSGRCRAKVHFYSLQIPHFLNFFLKIFILLFFFQVYDFVQLSELYYAGSHGMDIKGPSKSYRQRKVSQWIFFIFITNILFFLEQIFDMCVNIQGNQTVLCQPAREFLPIIDEVGFFLHLSLSLYLFVFLQKKKRMKNQILLQLFN